MTWTDADVKEFRKFLRAAGGDLEYPVVLTWNGGIDAQVRLPEGEDPGWAMEKLREFEQQHG